MVLFLLHLRLCTPFTTAQAVDLFAYDTNSYEKVSKTLVYNFSTLLFQQRLFIFVNHSDSTSFADWFPNLWWLEREVGELNGVSFAYKKDTRNLMLVYGENFNPFDKKNPSIGFREIYFDSLSNGIVSYPSQF